MTLRQFIAWLRGNPPPAPVPLPTSETLSYGSDPLQAFDVYRPANTFATDKRRAIVFVHGGGFVDGDKANPGVADTKWPYYCGKGDIFVSVNYRLSVDPATQAQDVAAAVNAVKAQPGVGSVVLMAHSAGGTDAALAVAYELCSADKLILLDPATLDAVDTMERPNPDPVFKPLGDDRAEWERNSPIAQLSGPIPATLIVTSGERGKAFAKQAQSFADKAMHLGCPSATVQAFPDLSHEDCNKLVGTPCALTDAIDRFLG